jgi:hypothetical protein
VQLKIRNPTAFCISQPSSRGKSHILSYLLKTGSMIYDATSAYSSPLDELTAVEDIINTFSDVALFLKLSTTFSNRKQKNVCIQHFWLRKDT